MRSSSAKKSSDTFSKKLGGLSHPGSLKYGKSKRYYNCNKTVTFIALDTFSIQFKFEAHLLAIKCDKLLYE